MTTKVINPGTITPRKKKGFFRTLGGQYQLMIMSVPMLLYVLLFNYAPMWGWIIAFQEYKPELGLLGSKWVGLDNFKFLFSKQDFILSIRNTFAMSLINLVFGTVSAILLALLLMRFATGRLSARFRRLPICRTSCPWSLLWVWLRIFLPATDQQTMCCWDSAW